MLSHSALCLSQLTTEPGRLILAALTDYGGYIVDDTGSRQGGGALCMEHAVNAEILQAYGYSVAIENPLTSSQVGREEKGRQCFVAKT